MQMAAMASATTTASALPAKGAWGNFGRRLLEKLSAVCEGYQQQRMILAASELDHPGVLADKEMASHRRDTAIMRGIFEGYSVIIPERKLRGY